MGAGDIIRFRRDGLGEAWGVVDDEGAVRPLAGGLDDLAARSVADARALVADAAAGHERLALDDIALLAPIGSQDVWAAGVTYVRSRDARIAESGGADLYDRVYASQRPELFFKASAAAVRGPREAVGVRRDARWSVPEPELAVVFNARMEVLGFSVGNDLSSRDIEGENALYLPQAKVYDDSCALGPVIRPVWELPQAPVFDIALRIRRAGMVLFDGRASTAQMARDWEELGRWLASGLTFPRGVVLLTGTGIVPGDDVSLEEGDEVEIAISGIGMLCNPVRRVGAPVPAAAGVER